MRHLRGDKGHAGGGVESVIGGEATFPGNEPTILDPQNRLAQQAAEVALGHRADFSGQPFG